MKDQNKFTKKPLHYSFKDACNGFIHLLRTERNFKLEFSLIIMHLLFSLLLQFSYQDTAIVGLTLFLILGAEAFNTAIEKLCDVVQPEFDQRIGIIKDISAAAVLLTGIGAFACACYIYPKYLLQLF